MENGDNLQGLRLGSIYDQVRIDWKKLHRLSRHILAPMATAGTPRKINYLFAYDGFHAVGHLKSGTLRSDASFRLGFEFGKVGVQLVFGNAFAPIKLIDTTPDF